MQSFLFNLGKPLRKIAPLTYVRTFLRDQLYLDRFESPTGYLALMGLAFLIAVAVGIGGVSWGMTLLGGAVLLPILVGSLFHLRFGVFMMLVLGFSILGFKRFFPSIPMGIIIDGMTLVLIFGLCIKQIQERNWRFLYNPVSFAVVLWLGYSFFQVVNPNPSSLLPWLYTVRHIAGLMLVFFVGLYVFDNMKAIRQLAYLWVALVTIGALYGLYQEFFGLNGAEQAWLMDDAQRFQLFYTWNRVRIFSFFSDPTVFGIMLAYTSLFCMVFVLSPSTARLSKILLGIGIAIMMLALVYTGTRTAFVIIPAGIFFFALLSMRKRILLITSIGLVAGVVFMLLPSENMHIKRLQSAFNPMESASFQVRVQNHTYIQPFIQSHPMGNGMGSIGVWGQRFSPDSFLSEFPPDSGYVRIGVEMGWIGLLLYCGLMFVVLWEGVVRYFQTKNRRLRTYYEAFLTLIFMLVLAHYPQQAITQLPTSLMFYFSMAVIIRLRDLDQTISEDDEIEAAQRKNAKRAGFSRKFEFLRKRNKLG